MPTTEEQLALARAERERRTRAEAKAPEEKSFMDRLQGVGKSALGLIDQVNTGAYSMVLPRKAEEFLINKGAMSDIRQSPDGPLEAGARMVGQSIPLVAGGVALGTKQAAATAMQPAGWLSTFLSNMSKTAAANPVAFYGSEAAGAMGAGMAGEAAREGGAGTAGQLISEVAGGATAAGLTQVLPRSLRSAKESIFRNLAPMTEEGGMLRAAAQTQARAGGIERAERMATGFDPEDVPGLDTIPKGVTPAQWIGDERLMAQEARLLSDNPQLAAQVKGELEDARMAAQDSLKDMFGNPRDRTDWQMAVLERVTPDGTTIARGQTDEMLDAAYESFAPLYDQAKGYSIAADNLENTFRSAARDENIISDPAQRDSIEKWLLNRYRAYRPRIENGEISSDDLISLRSDIRTERRSQSRRGNLERADLLGTAEADVTKMLEDQLPDEVVTSLKATDSKYRTYKVVEDAIFNAGDSKLTPEQLSQSIRMGGLTSNSRYARGVDETTQSLRQLALGGRSTEEILGDPDRAALMVRGLPDNARKAVQSDFMNVLFNRAKESSTQASEGGVSFISGAKLQKDLFENKSVMRSLGMTSEEISRAQNMARTIQRMEKRAPAPVGELFEDGPATVMQLAATLMGAKSGQRMAGHGMGSSLVLAQFMSNKARGTLSRLTSDEAARLMEDAVTDTDLYKALLTKPIASTRRKKEAAQQLEAWLMNSAASAAQEELGNEQSR